MMWRNGLEWLSAQSPLLAAWANAAEGVNGAWPASAALALVVAVWVDMRWGEPPARWHPVVWMGAYLSACAAWVAPAASAAPTASAASTAQAGQGRANRARAFVAGAVAWCVLAALALALAAGVQHLARLLPWWLTGVLLGVVLKPLLAWRMLRDEVLAVEAAVQQSPQAGRAQVAQLVSRDTATLTPAQVRAAALSTLAENVNDSVIAPLCWFVLWGLPGAMLWRVANTADAMWGYRGQRHARDWTWAGKWAARADDALGWLPARLTALLLLATHRRPSGGRTPWRQLPQEARRTPSPNGGWPMATLALGLNVRLDKLACYTLYAAGQPADAAHTPAAVDWCQRAVLLACAAGVTMLALVAWWAWRVA